MRERDHCLPLPLFSVCFLLPFLFPAEPPVVDIQRVGTADGATVPKGGTITLRCDPVAGFPEPTLRWDSVPPSSQQGTDGDSLTITVSNVNSDFCIDCIGQSTSGTHSDQECVVIRKSSPVPSVLQWRI